MMRSQVGIEYILLLSGVILTVLIMGSYLISSAGYISNESSASNTPSVAPKGFSFTE